ncbi:MAG: P13 family porin [Sphaerochaeta sp.]|jgi:hypothetical protein|nr:P13 family porin [Sphaerochaeta sp.]
MGKRTVSIILLCLGMATLSAAIPVVDLLKIGYDLATIKRVTKMDIDGVQISLGGISVRGLKRTMAGYDFTGLAFEDRSALYEKAKVPIALPAVRNVLQGMGKGSKSQGDLGGKLFGMVGDWASYGVISVGIILIAVDAFIVGIFSGGESGTFDWNREDDELLTMGKNFLTWGLVGFASQRLIQLAIPIGYGMRYNKTLRDGLGITRDGFDRFSLSMGLDPVDEVLMVGATIQL